MIKYFVGLLPLMLAGCVSSQDAPPPPDVVSVGMSNPAAVYCEQKGGTRTPVQTPQGVRSDCTLPGGERIDEWTLFRRDHPQP